MLDTLIIRAGHRPIPLSLCVTSHTGFPDMRTVTRYPIQFGSGDWITVVTRATGTFTR